MDSSVHTFGSYCSYRLRRDTWAIVVVQCVVSTADSQLFIYVLNFDKYPTMDNSVQEGYRRP